MVSSTQEPVLLYTLTVNNVVASDEGNYQVTIKNDAGSMGSAVAVLIIYKWHTLSMNCALHMSTCNGM